ncbi:MAG: hypothetical protein EOP51_12785 [Sphingobacteriales bacterium]|nr:MAG: hypothetical protein EOP51_12785 [Sphingobacteriales bacterium]
MELDEMKLLWQQYDNNIQKNNSLNNMIVKKLLQQNSKDIVGKMTGFEYLNISVGGIFTLLILLSGPTFLKLPGVDMPLTSCYIIAALAALCALSLNFYMINFLNHTDLSKPVTEALPRIDKLRQLTVKGKLMNVILLPIIIVTAVAVGRKWVYDENIFQTMTFWGPALIIGVVLGLIATIFLYRTLYTNRIKTIRMNLEEIEQFKQG